MRQSGVEAEPETAIAIDVAVNHGSRASSVVCVEAASPSGVGQHLLDHQGNDVSERELDQMETGHPDLLIAEPVEVIWPLCSGR